MKPIVFILLSCFSLVLKAQTTLFISDSTWVKLSNNSKIIIGETNTPINKTGNIGGILTETETTKIILNIDTLSGNFVVPFTSSLGNTIPLTYNITNSGLGNGKYSFSTYETDDYNSVIPIGVSLISPTYDFLIDRFWVIEPNGYIINPNGDLTLTYDDNDLIGNYISEIDFVAQFWHLTYWDIAISNIDPLTNSVVISNLNNKSIWTLANNTVSLPISLINFNANCTNNTLEWKTESEVNNAIFIIEGTNNGIDFIVLDTIEGAGNTNTITTYSITISEPYNYYRLSQVDYNGLITYFNLILGCPNKNLTPSIFPNPNSGIFRLDNDSFDSVEITDIYGNKIMSEVSNKNYFDVSHIQNGLYLLTLSNEKTYKKTIKFIKTN